MPPCPIAIDCAPEVRGILKDCIAASSAEPANAEFENNFTTENLGICGLRARLSRRTWQHYRAAYAALLWGTGWFIIRHRDRCILFWSEASSYCYFGRRLNWQQTQEILRLAGIASDNAEVATPYRSSLQRHRLHCGGACSDI